MTADDLLAGGRQVIRLDCPLCGWRGREREVTLTLTAAKALANARLSLGQHQRHVHPELKG